MNKHFLNFTLAALVCSAMSASFTSCKDYDDDIDNIQNQIDKINVDQERHLDCRRYIIRYEQQSDLHSY